MGGNDHPRAGENGELAADVFTLLDEGVHPVEGVKRMRRLPSVVESLHAQWSRMKGHLLIPFEIRLQIETDLVGLPPGPCGWAHR